VEAIRHAQAAQDWGLAARLLADNWPGLQLGGQAATVHVILAGFPAEATAADAELATVAAADELAHGSPEEAERFLGLAARRFEGPASVPALRGLAPCDDGPWGLRRDRGPGPAGPLALVRVGLFLVRGCSGGSGRRG
jgi:LuxR family maltose regulon positive regulatory protein